MTLRRVEKIGFSKLELVQSGPESGMLKNFAKFLFQPRIFESGSWGRNGRGTLTTLLCLLRVANYVCTREERKYMVCVRIALNAIRTLTTQSFF